MATRASNQLLFHGATFDDFLQYPQKGVLETRRRADLSMSLTRDISLKLPILGSNVDTVTGPEMAKALALEGGIGILHRNCDISAEVAAVKYVKQQHAFIIEQPQVLHRAVTLGEAKEHMDRLRVSGILLEEKPGSRVLAGILSHRDVPQGTSEFDDDPVERFMTPAERLITASPGISLEDAERLMYKHRKEKLPLINGKHIIRGLITMRDLRLAKQRPYSSKDKKGRLLVGAAIGARGDFIERAKALLDADVDCLVMDVAHAHSVVIEQAVKEFRRVLGKVPLICGNIGTFEGAKFLARLGVDGVKVGIGPGRGCRTRLEVGSGVPQMQAINEAYHGVAGRIPIVADGGIRNDKDIAFAIFSGASTVMLGNMLAGTEEAPGVVIDNPRTGQKVKLYRGMTSPQAVLANATDHEIDELLETPQEGQSLEVPYKGGVTQVLTRIRGHLQSSVSYAGEVSLFKAHKKIVKDPAKYLTKLSPAARAESFER